MAYLNRMALPKKKQAQNNFSYMKNIILFPIIYLCAVGCQTTHQIETNEIVQKNRSDDLALSSLYGDIQGGIITALISNISREDLFVEIPLEGLGFDLEYSTSDGNAMWLNGLSYGGYLLPVRTLHLLKPANLDKKGVVIGYNPIHTLFLTITVPEDAVTIRRLECYVNYIKVSDFNKITGTKDLDDIFYKNGIYLRIIEPGLVPGEDVYDSQSKNSTWRVDPVLDHTIRGYIR